MRVMDGLSLLEIGGAGNFAMCPVLVRDESDAVLFDAGLPGQMEKILSEMAVEGVPFSELTHILITHQDMDHIGSLAALQRAAAGQVKVMCQMEEKDYIQFDRIPAKMSKERILQHAAEYLEKTGIRIPDPFSLDGIRILFADVTAVVDDVLADGQELNVCGGIVAIHTPGHTPGHCCYYLKKFRTLVAGDAMNVREGILSGPNPVYTKDPVTARASLAKLSAYDIQTVLCYHGGAISGPEGMNSAIAALVSE